MQARKKFDQEGDAHTEDIHSQPNMIKYDQEQPSNTYNSYRMCRKKILYNMIYFCNIILIFLIQNLNNCH